mmetsp:Transcript_7902/g.22421  ORF Transcript_7902/g.22421 Transcript_7902/m.22421 type:complete len:204 (-) Transcript_7902:1124-1735(-)
MPVRMWIMHERRSIAHISFRALCRSFVCPPAWCFLCPRLFLISPPTPLAVIMCLSTAHCHRQGGGQQRMKRCERRHTRHTLSHSHSHTKWRRHKTDRHKIGRQCPALRSPVVDTKRMSFLCQQSVALPVLHGAFPHVNLHPGFIISSPSLGSEGEELTKTPARETSSNTPTHRHTQRTIDEPCRHATFTHLPLSVSVSQSVYL